AQQFGIDVSEGGEIRVEKIVSLYTSRDTAISECGLEARKTVMDAGSFDDLLEPHTEDWAHLWRRFDVQFEHEDPEEGDYTEMVLHLHVFHLLQTTSTNTKDLDVGVPSRGWHGEAYRGHILWDELFIFPLLNLRIPAITHALLMYRFRRMNEARRLAREAGYCGAMYPWQSGSNGREESQEIHLNPESGRWIPDHSHLQRHVNAAIAYNTWQFYQVTGDKEFLSFYGSEMILEIARFWSAITTYNEELDRFEILGIMGPDEFHDGYPDTDKPGVDNNAYTNIMVVWVMCRACEILHDLLPEDRAAEICESLDIEEEEIQRWQEISRKMRIEFHDDGIISQFQGYGELKEFDWERYRRKYGNIQRLDRILEAEGDDVNCYKVSKQADVLMLFYLFSSEELKELFERLGYEFPKELIPRNVEYYQQRTSHGSTLSWVVDAWVMARQDRARSWHLFKDALKVDVEDIQGGTTPEGIHLGAMAGSVDLMKRGYTGLDPRGDILWINPRLPDEVKKLRMQIHYRGHSLILEITPKQLRINAYRAAEAPITIGFKGKKHELTAGEVMELSLEKS
ncbi:MAG: glycoside hydrolase family 65 protein, partial [Desulfovibrionales bacterium]